MSAHNKAPPALAAILAGIDIDAADVIAAATEECSGRYVTGHEVNACSFATGYAVELLGRALSATETSALEACVRHYLRAAEKGATS